MRNRQQESGEPVAFTNLLWEALNNANRKKIEDHFEQQGRSTVQAMECWEVRKNRKGEIEKKEFAKITNEHPFYEELKKHEDQVAERGTKEALDEEIEKDFLKNKKVQKLSKVEVKDKQWWLVCYTQKWQELTEDQIRFAYLHQVLAIESERLIQEIRAQIYHVENPDHLRFWISEIQMNVLNDALELLVGELKNIPLASEFLKPNYGPKDLKALTLFQLNQCILLIKRKYGHLLTDEVHEYMRTYQDSSSELQNKISQLEKRIANYTNQDLKEIIQAQCRTISEVQNGNSISLHEYSYAKTILNEISNVANEQGNEDTFSEKVAEILLRNNFNDTAFIAWWTKKIQKELSSLQGIENGRPWLLNEQKKLRQLIPSSKLCFRPGIPGAIELLVRWIQEEIAYLEGIQHSNPEKTAFQKKETGDQPKLTTSFNVPQLALFASLLAEEGIIQESNKMQLFSVFSSTFKTVNQPNIAIASLRNNYYDKDPKNMELLKNKLIQMVNRINQNLNAKDAF